MHKIITLFKNNPDEFYKKINETIDHNKDGYLLLLSAKDTYEKNFDEKMADILDHQQECVLVTAKHLFQFPDRISGVMINLAKAGKSRINMSPAFKYNRESAFLLKLVSEKSFAILQDTDYIQSEPGDGNYQEFDGLYEKDWYTKDFDNFLIPMLNEESSLNGNQVPEFIQFFAMYYIRCRLDANKDNRNRHVLSGNEIIEFKDKIREALQMIQDDIIMNSCGYPVYSDNFERNRMLLRIKYNSNILSHTLVDIPENRSNWIHVRESLHKAAEKEVRIIDTLNFIADPVPFSGLVLSYNGTLLYGTTLRLKCNIQAMDLIDGVLEIDGSVPDIFPKDEVEYYFKYGSRHIDVKFDEGYSLTKYFGIAAYKRFPFHASIKIDVPESGCKEHLTFCISHNGKEYPVVFEYMSHFSRLSSYPSSSYWHSGAFIFENEYTVSGYLNEKRVSSIIIRPYRWCHMAKREIMIWGALIFSFKMHRFRFFLLRFAWVMTHPFFRSEIWMFYDKIYKGGDSSEYLFRYASAQNDGIKKYYLLDKKTPDYLRLKSDGFKPLKRGSFLHRLIFLNADMMIVSNSTVFAFNDYYMENSQYIRGIPDFHVVCVQHGLSVQKIALAQQRLRDNTRLYFCASKYEIKNLSQPIYNYNITNALQLTGVPRYDGLIDNAKKQIMISPTWRMQAAHLVTKNEGVERDYNPEFKDTPYFKVYNNLINDKKLISAAKEYGYRISYVLHPIVCPQLKDFTKNDFVDIIPSVGDMSYEKMFRESSLMVTDYSGIQFDFAYMRKPLVYYHPEELEAHYEEGTYHYNTMAFGEIVKKKDELVNLLIDYMKSGCKMKPEYVNRADDFFAFSDQNNCKRIYNVMQQYSDTVLKQHKRFEG